MNIAAIIQARMSSKRFPGKVLCMVNNKPLLLYLVESLKHCHSLQLVTIATSIEKSDDPIADFSHHQGIECFRGSLTDVAGRFKTLLAKHRWEAFVRVSADSPLLDHRLIERGIKLYRDGDSEIVTNVFPRTFPSGQSVEIIKSDTFRNAYERMESDYDREHVTSFFYQQKGGFKVLNFSSEADYSDVDLSVDTKEDFRVFSQMINSMKKPHWDYNVHEIIKLYRNTNREITHEKKH